MIDFFKIVFSVAIYGPVMYMVYLHEWYMLGVYIYAVVVASLFTVFTFTVNKNL